MVMSKNKYIRNSHMTDARVIDTDALNKAVKRFADEMEGRYEYYTTTSHADRKANPHHLYSKSNHVYSGRLNIALLAQGAPGIGQDNQDDTEGFALQTKIANEVAKDWANSQSPYMAAIWNSDALKGNPDVARILRTEAKFVLYNTPDTASVKYKFTKVVGEVVGLLGAKAIRDEVRSLPEVRKKAAETIQRLEL